MAFIRCSLSLTRDIWPIYSSYIRPTTYVEKIVQMRC